MVRISLPFLRKGSSPPVSNLNNEPVSPTATLFEQEPQDEVSLDIHPAPKYSGILIKVQPPRAPPALDPPPSDADKDKGKGRATAASARLQPTLPRTPCDIVLVIDVSGSMYASAPIPGNGDEPDYGFSVLDLTKHAALTILETLDERDRLGVVTFSHKAKTLRTLEVMTEKNKKACKEAILEMYPEGATNLWGGMMVGLDLFEKAGKSEGRVPAMMVLTDGQPNIQCPSRGYVPKLLERDDDKPIIPAIHTFGFGNNLRSGLLKSIADVGRGGYSFIPDSSMLGTVFVHTLANLQSTYSNHTSLRLRYPHGFKLETTTGIAAAAPKPIEVEEDGVKFIELTVPLGNLQFGQSRDIFLLAPDGLGSAFSPSAIQATLTYSRMTKEVRQVTSQADLLGPPAASFPQPAEVAYQVSRSRICDYLGSLYRLRSDEEHTAVLSEQGRDTKATKRVENLKKLITELPARAFADDKGPNESLLLELDEERDGQIPLAVGSKYFGTWGSHYLLSLKSAHERQICNSFKDPGPLQYSKDSPLFIQCRDILDCVFDNMEPPPPSLRTSYRGEYNMGLYRNVLGPCFAGSTLVSLASGKQVEIRKLRKGVAVTTPRGPRRIETVLATPVESQIMIRLGDVLVTPWHPVARAGLWKFPAKIKGRSAVPVRYRGVIYSVLLERDEDPEAHAIAVGMHDVWGVTLGHGITKGGGVRAHKFLGNWWAVKKGLEDLGRRRGDKVVVGGGIVKDAEGLVCGFAPYRGVRRMRMEKVEAGADIL
ncbi:hypothetical protein jhhlp_002721 [Lomentospora prolificans]|uniref:VWFA domain-containing protein n=1 Tax=Lomentospora prolificans TaxID=41688 RepID=A0A2N3NF20_9PEZI|nr:hypothetical protein jhhlp_002721 [Lomentospora prolificans]